MNRSITSLGTSAKMISAGSLAKNKILSGCEADCSNCWCRLWWSSLVQMLASKVYILCTRSKSTHYFKNEVNWVIYRRLSYYGHQRVHGILVHGWLSVHLKQSWIFMSLAVSPSWKSKGMETQKKLYFIGEAQSITFSRSCNQERDTKERMVSPQ